MQDHEKAMMMKIRDAKMRSVLRSSWWLRVAAILQYIAMVYSSFFSLQNKTSQPQSPTWELQQRILDATDSEAQGATWVTGTWNRHALTLRFFIFLHISSYFFLISHDSSYIFLPSLVPIGPRSSPVPQEERLRVALQQQVRMRPQGQLSLHWSAPELAPPWIGCRPWKIACLAEFWTLTFVKKRCATPENWQNRNPFSTPKDSCVKSGFGNWDGGCRHGSQLNRSWTIVEPCWTIWIHLRHVIECHDAILYSVGILGVPGWQFQESHISHHCGHRWDE